jgi:hypothetical protein
MKLCKRIFAAVALLLSAAGLLICLTGAAGVWMLAGPVTDRANQLFGRIERALDIVDVGVSHAGSSLAEAAQRLDSARQEQSQIPQGAGWSNVTRRLLARTVQQSVIPDIRDANETLHKVAEAAVVINSVLEDIGSVPFLASSGLDLDRLTDLNQRLSDVGPAAWELSRLLGEPPPEGGDDTAANRLSRVEETLKTMRISVDDFGSRVMEVRERTAALKSNVQSWIRLARAILPPVFLWLALSQASVLVHAWRWLK